MLLGSFIFLAVVALIAESGWDNQELYADKNTEDKQSKTQTFVNSSGSNKGKSIRPLPKKRLLNYILLPKLSQQSLNSFNRDNYVFWPKLLQYLLKSSTRDNYTFWPSLLEYTLKSNRNEYVSRFKRSQYLSKYSNNDNYNFWLSLLELLLKSSKQCGCGSSVTLGPNKLIIDGKKLKYMKSYPFMVSLHDKGSKNDGWGMCGGAIISPTFVMSAAHCAVNFQKCPKQSKPIKKCRKKPSEVEIGILGKNTQKPDHKVEVKRIIIHPKYEMQHSPNDIALYELKKPIPCTDYSRPICLSPKLLTKPGEILNIVGAGGTKVKTGSMSSEIHHAVTYSVKSEKCSSKGKKDASIVCAKGIKQGACHGDSGTSAFLDYQGHFYSVGLTSIHTSADCNPAKPVIYTSVSYFYQFIAKHVKNLPKPQTIHIPMPKNVIIGF